MSYEDQPESTPRNYLYFANITRPGREGVVQSPNFETEDEVWEWVDANELNGEDDVFAARRVIRGGNYFHDEPLIRNDAEPDRRRLAELIGKARDALTEGAAKVPKGRARQSSAEQSTAVTETPEERARIMRKIEENRARAQDTTIRYDATEPMLTYDEVYEGTQVGELHVRPEYADGVQAMLDGTRNIGKTTPKEEHDADQEAVRD